jgi:hypothetical protein
LWAPFFLTAHTFTALYNALPFPHAPHPARRFLLALPLPLRLGHCSLRFSWLAFGVLGGEATF